MTDDEREKLRQECHKDLDALRAGGELPERAYRLFEKLVSRLDRLETGSFHVTEAPTEPERPRRISTTLPAQKGPGWSAEKVIAELEEGKKKNES